MIIKFNYYNQDVLVDVNEEQDIDEIKQIVINAVKLDSDTAMFDLSSVISDALMDSNCDTAKVIEDEIYVDLDELCDDCDEGEGDYTVVAYEDVKVIYKKRFDNLALAEIVAKEISEMISDVYGKNCSQIIDNEGDIYDSYCNYNSDKSFDLKKIEEIIEKFTKK